MAVRLDPLRRKCPANEPRRAIELKPLEAVQGARENRRRGPASHLDRSTAISGRGLFAGPTFYGFQAIDFYRRLAAFSPGLSALRAPGAV